MKTYTIYLMDFVSRELVEVEKIETGNLLNIKTRLIELQQGYCEDEQPTCDIETMKHGDQVFHGLVSRSHSDYGYISPTKNFNV